MKKEVKKELEAKIALYLGYIGQLEKVVTVAKSYDNKVMNKKFADLVENAVGNVHISYNRGYYGRGENYLFSFISDTKDRYNDGNIFYVYDSKNGDRAFVINNRFNHAKFSKIVQVQIDYYKGKVAQMESELKTGFELVEQYNLLIQQAVTIANSFSDELRETVESKGGFVRACSHNQLSSQTI